MGLRQLKRLSEELDHDEIATLAPAAKICRYKGVIITACTIIKSLVPPILWGIAIKAAMEGAIAAVQSLCPDEVSQKH